MAELVAQFAIHSDHKPLRYLPSIMAANRWYIHEMVGATMAHEVAPEDNAHTIGFEGR